MPWLWMVSAGGQPPGVYLPSTRKFREAESAAARAGPQCSSTKNGEQVFEVAPDTPTVIRVLRDRSLLNPGANVLVPASQKNGGLVATRVTAEKDGVKPR
jgi:hypothetical protein